MNKFFFAAVIIIGLGIVYYSLYAYNYNEFMLLHAQSENLTLYENKDYDFSMGYPSTNWTVREYDLAPNEVVVFEGPQPNDIVSIKVQSMPMLKGMNMLDLIEQFKVYLSGRPEIRTVEVGDTTVSGFTAIQAIYYDSSGFSNTKVMETVALTNNSRSDQYSITYNADPAYFDRNLPLVDEMVKSFEIGLE